MGPELPLEDVCQQIFEHLIPAMQFPEIASAMIELDGRRFTTENYGQGVTHELQSKITVRTIGYAGGCACSILKIRRSCCRKSRAHRRNRGDLERWLKEMNCLYEIRRGA